MPVGMDLIQLQNLAPRISPPPHLPPVSYIPSPEDRKNILYWWGRHGEDAQRDRPPTELVEQVLESAVEVLSQNKKNRLQLMGAGIAVAKDLVITCYHCVKGMDANFVRTFNGSLHQAKILCMVKRRDLALLRVDYGKLRPIPFSPDDAIKKGEPVFCVGTTGDTLELAYGKIVKQKRRPVTDNLLLIMDGSKDSDVVMHDVQSCPGYSGGGLINMKGQLVGIHAFKMICTRTRVAIGLNHVMELIDQNEKTEVHYFCTYTADYSNFKGFKRRGLKRIFGRYDF